MYRCSFRYRIHLPSTRAKPQERQPSWRTSSVVIGFKEINIGPVAELAGSRPYEVFNFIYLHELKPFWFTELRRHVIKK